MSAIERVEIIRGPASALYGADAFLGLINILTRDQRQRRRGAGLAGGWRRGRQEPGHDVDVSLGTTRGMVQALLAFRHTRQDLSGLQLPDSSPAPNIPDYNAGARTAKGADQSSTSAIAKLTLRPRVGRTLSLFGYYSLADRGSEFGSLFQLANGYNERNTFSENRVALAQLRAGLHYSEDLSERLKLSIRAEYFQGGTRDNNRLEVGSEFYYVRRRFGFRGGDVDAHVEWSPTAEPVAGHRRQLDRRSTATAFPHRHCQAAGRGGQGRRDHRGGQRVSRAQAVHQRRCVPAGHLADLRRAVGTDRWAPLRPAQRLRRSAVAPAGSGRQSVAQPARQAAAWQRVPGPLAPAAVCGAIGQRGRHWQPAAAPAVREHLRVRDRIRALGLPELVDRCRVQPARRQDRVRPARNQQGRAQRLARGQPVLGEQDRAEIPGMAQRPPHLGAAAQRAADRTGRLCRPAYRLRRQHLSPHDVARGSWRPSWAACLRAPR